MEKRYFRSITEKTRKEFVAGFVVGLVVLGIIAIILLVIFTR